MINFDDELSRITGLAFNEITSGFKVSLINSSHVVIEGQFGLVSFSETETEFKVKGSKLKVVGENLKIKKINKELAIIFGKILTVNLGDKDGKTKV